MIRLILPGHLHALTNAGGEVELQIAGQATQCSVLDALEAKYPVLRGTIRDHVSQRSRPYLRFFACQGDLSHELPDAPLPHAAPSGAEPLPAAAAIAGGWRQAMLRHFHRNRFHRPLHLGVPCDSFFG